ncbi:hypothetical protein [Flavisolibacter nicotianae]|uniref:hypothetical protein n=1 Tax=Flavisolibacter nicotianae TaxID=2364882 RepID=UPI000EB117DD|nr:hypothetical protein [Flavisolibacter nicotianae]
MNVINRGMGGVSAAYSDIFSINYNNPASYAGFQVFQEQRSKKVSSARVILDAAVSYDSRKLAEPNTTSSFTSNDILFSHVYVGVPIRKNWGLAFGIRPLSRISYDILRTEQLHTPSGMLIDSAFTQYSGSGGSFLPSIGTGFGTNNFRVGVNIGYLFGKKELVTRRGFLSDTISYAASNHTTNTNFGGLFYTVGTQWSVDLSKKAILRLGASGNWKQTINGTQDIHRQTYTRNSSGQEVQVDSVFSQTDSKGSVIYPGTYTAGFMLDLAPGQRTNGWNIGVDYAAGKWNDYRFFGAQDLVQNNWELRFGAQITPSEDALQNGKLKSYRIGFFTGRDYVKVGNDLPVVGFSLGLGLPLRNYSRLSNQASVLNFGLEYIKRGNDQNLIKEDLFRLSLGLNFTDFWFGKRKYD